MKKNHYTGLLQKQMVRQHPLFLAVPMTTLRQIALKLFIQYSYFTVYFELTCNFDLINFFPTNPHAYQQ